LLRFDVGGDTRGGWASTTSGTRGGRVGGVGRVEPEHVDVVVVPDGEDENHTLGHGLVHGGEATLGSEIVGVAERGLLSSAEGCGDGVVGSHTGNVGLGVGDDDTVLDVEAADLVERTAGGTVAGEELGDDGELGVGVDLQAWAVVGGVTHTVRVEVATVLVAHTTVAVGTVTAFGARASVLAVDCAAVRSVGSGVLVGLPDIHLIAAGSVVTLAGVGVVGGWGPALNVSLS
jgi:hypothetical protein